MKTRNISIAIFIMAILAALSCNQDPIFYIISTETAPLKPLIEGTPTNMVVFERMYPDPDYPDPSEPGYPDPGVPGHFISVPILYVASGNRIHWYAKSDRGTGVSKWNSGEYGISQPGGKVTGLAVTSTHLYVLCRNESNQTTTLRRIGHMATDHFSGGIGEPADTWKTISSPYSQLQTIYADIEQDCMFAGTLDAILYVTSGETTLQPLQNQTSMLSGAVYDDANDLYFLSTRGNGIYQVSASGGVIDDPLDIKQLTYNSVPGGTDTSDDRLFMGMIKLENGDIIAVERASGYLYQVEPDAFERISYSGDLTGMMAADKSATGAIALWKEDHSNPASKLLVIGVKDPLSSSYFHGYVEFELNPDGSLKTDTSRLDQEKKNLYSAPDNDRYSTTIGKYPLNHLFQAPFDIDNSMTFFASTQTTGLWSYRDRGNNGAEWNAEN